MFSIHFGLKMQPQNTRALVLKLQKYKLTFPDKNNIEVKNHSV